MWALLILASIISMVTAITISEQRATQVEWNTTNKLVKHQMMLARERELERRRLYWLWCHYRRKYESR